MAQLTAISALLPEKLSSLVFLESIPEIHKHLETFLEARDPYPVSKRRVRTLFSELSAWKNAQGLRPVGLYGVCFVNLGNHGLG